MNPIRHYIPSMFHRRVVLLVLMSLSALLVLSGRLGYMTIAHGEDARAQAEKLLVRTTWLPTTRGSIFDRKGRVIAGDRASYDIAIDYRILSGRWVYETSNGRLRTTSVRARATTLARRANPDIWDELPDPEREQIVARFEGALRARVAEMERMIIEITRTNPADFAQRKQEILDRVGSLKAHHSSIVYRNKLEDFERNGWIPSEDDYDRFRSIADSPIEEEHAPHALVSDIPDEVGFDILRIASQRTPIVSEGVDPALLESLSIPLFPGLTVLDSTARINPFETQVVSIDRSGFPPPLRDETPITMRVPGVGRQLLGRIDDSIYREDNLARREALESDDDLRARSLTPRGTDRGQYFTTGDRVGRTGIEEAYEHHLRGIRGLEIRNLQTGQRDELDREHGRDVHLSIDIQLQARIRALLNPALGLTRVQEWHNNEQGDYTPTGTDLDAGVVVLDIPTGEILALVSTPNPPLSESEWRSLGVFDETGKRLYNTIHSPWTNKAIAKPYPPGSVAKALILTEAAKRGAYRGERIHDRGYLLDNQPNKFRSWIYKMYDGAHGGHSDQLDRDLDGVDALMVSSNVFFYTLGRRLGPDGIARAYQDYHVARPYNLGIGTEWPGSIGRFGGPNDGSDINLDEATLMGIGQGPITWTPLHAADAMATLSRFGMSITPRIVRDGRAPDTRDISIPSWAAQDAMRGLREVVENRRFGTGRAITYPELGPESVDIFNVPGLTVWGKTGTAEAPPLRFDPDGNGPIEPYIVRMGDHSWYVTMVAPAGESPRYAIAVIVEYAGSGGKVSGPINNEIIRALVEEGYLPRMPNPAGPGA